ncbi:MAG: GNAT family N-acetyltransferase [Candidatus Lutacidiplasmatales archaeon]
MRRGTPGTVRRIRADEGPALRTIRLAALASDPLAFGSTFDVEELHPPSHWGQRASAGAASDTDVILFLVHAASPPHGMVGAFTHEGSRYLWGMWVAPDRRGERAGAALLEAVLAWCAEHPAEHPVRLEVNPSQVAAVRLYERHGFRPSADDRPLGHHAPATKRPMQLVRDAAGAGQADGTGQI